jgi:hypothetical protein
MASKQNVGIWVGGFDLPFEALSSFLGRYLTAVVKLLQSVNCLVDIWGAVRCMAS